jgi:phage-related minor tail protein
MGIGVDPGMLSGFATGGAVLGGRAIMVGEGGPEMFVPQSAGRIVPNGQMGGGTVNMTVMTPDARSFKQSQGQILQDAFRATSRAARRSG